MTPSKVLPIWMLIMLLTSTACAAAQPAVLAPAANPAGGSAQVLAQAPAQTGQPGEEAQAASATLTVLAAASLTEAFTEIGRIFEVQHPGVTVEFSFAGSQQLAQQLDHGAPADVFASANTKYMAAAVQSGRVTEGTAEVFATNRLVVIFPKDNPGDVQALADLAKPGLKLILAAKEVPVGQYSLDFLNKAIRDPAFGAFFKDDVLKNVVSYEQTVKAVLTKVVLAEADAGIVYLSDISADAAMQVSSLDIPDALNVIATYPIAAINDSQNSGPAQEFVDFVLSPAGQKVLEKYNFIPAR